MPDRGGSPDWWFALGRLLPGEVRRRLFEPACYDLARERLTQRRNRSAEWRFTLRAMGVLVASSWCGAQLLLLDRRRMLKVARVLGWVLLALSLATAFALRDCVQQLATLYQ